MKPEELMIGDYVQWKDRCVRVASVSGIVYSFGQQDVVLQGCNDDKLLESHLIECISPIPLTHEFMAKNFGENKGRGYFYFDDFIELSIWEVNDGTFLVECDHVEFSSMPGEQVMVSSVHQLQHFLRHICYEKEIVL